jgi:uncharacterized protein (TIGR02118 family)
MVRILALHRLPNDPETFERHYREVHTPLVHRLPGLRDYRLGRVLRRADGAPTELFMVSDAYFDDEAALQAALNSPEMQAALADVPNFASGGVDIYFCESEEFPPGAGS